MGIFVESRLCVKNTGSQKDLCRSNCIIKREVGTVKKEGKLVDSALLRTNPLNFVYHQGCP